MKTEFDDLLGCINLFDEIYKTKKDLQNVFFDLQILQEKKFEVSLGIAISNIRDEMLSKIDILEVAMEKTNEVANTTIFLQKIKLNPLYSYKKVKSYYFQHYSIPVEIKDYLNKSKNIVDNIIKDNTVDAYNLGGNLGLKIFDIPIEFKMLSEGTKKYLKTNANDLAGNFAKQLSTGVRYEIYEGIKNNETIKDIRNRIINVWDNVIEVRVPPKVINEEIVSSGYTYRIDNNVWITTVARTETTEAFTNGKLESFSQIGVVDYVEYVTAEDEATCDECLGMGGMVYPLEQSFGVIPIHGRCRCSFIPLLANGMDYNTAKDLALENIYEIYEIG